jgi:hypothetical protein
MKTKIIAFAGRKQSGKSSAADLLYKHFFLKGRIQLYNFADPLKKLCVEILGLTYEQVYGTNDQKNELVNCYWENKQLRAREVLQLVGTDMFRKLQHNVWADATIREIQKYNPDFAVIADCRFSNEINAIKKVGGIVIKLTRNPYNSDHISETALDPNNYDQSNFDYIVDNHNMTIEEKDQTIKQYLQLLGL